ncbi:MULTISPECIES: chemotaxis protein CheX [Heyndrickxia]|uniref:chemotaxis protein CheX n=1 Tax=Heyndrickxia TaxID=2837504 RepID=UPI001B25DBCD|nr:chemotaxis protein CheX [Heyndrickxia oleronia]GIN38127.1 CheY-P phosphatase CheX [Heyndrickxia oleronia]
MTQTKNVTDVLNSTIEALQSVLPFTIIIDSPKLFKSPIAGHTVGVLIGITGDIKGRMIIDAEKEIISKIGEGMFGMPLQKEMLESFAGELGNMLAGNMSTSISQKGFIIDITPPTVIIGHSKFSGFEKALCLPVNIEQAGVLNIILSIEM